MISVPIAATLLQASLNEGGESPGDVLPVRLDGGACFDHAEAIACALKPQLAIGRVVSRAAGDARDRFAAGLFGGPRFHVFVEHGDLDRIEPSLGDAGALRRCGRRPSATLKTVLVRLYAAGPGRGGALRRQDIAWREAR